jgi:hypothetical protein
MVASFSPQELTTISTAVYTGGVPSVSSLPVGKMDEVLRVGVVHHYSLGT